MPPNLCRPVWSALLCRRLLYCVLITGGVVGGADRLAAQILPSAANAPAAAAPQPERTTASYGDWVLRCVLPVGSQRSCEVAQTIQDTRAQILAQVTARRSLPGALLLLTVQVGAHITIGDPIRLMADEQAALALAFRRCMPRGCFAEVALPDGEVIAFAQRAEAARVEYTNAEGATLSIPVSLRGLAASLEALQAAERR
ncbi:invasion associated locus B family protein [Roseomonas sp. 18066]|uniref:invasion associated locus B family protein n=1 Tax=Roseomonas sp. 18066 TaxID=2681412 RepID=UPI0021031DB0|nr:invasion associated locus B family protein [Roseomonas sp. 18066]